MAKNYNPVEVSITLAGKKCYLFQLKLTQRFNSQHSFMATIDHEEFGELWMESPGAIFGMVGEDALIEFRHRDGTGVNLFSGIITNVEFAGKNGEQNYIVFYGHSPTIRLDGKKAMDSFMDKDLSAIVNEAVGNSGNGGSVSAAPKFTSSIDYICQYDETCFEFLNRLSWLYGEWFFYDGTTCYFGNPGLGGSSKVIYDMEMPEMKFSARLLPTKVNRYHYLHHDDKEIEKEPPGSIPGVSGYHTVPLGKSDSIYTSDADVPAPQVVNSMSELEEMVKAEKGRTVSEMLILQGITQTSKIKIGEEIQFELPPSMRTTIKAIGTFLITAVEHTYSQEGIYSNTFTGIPAGMEQIPMNPVEDPKAFSQLATVKTNADEEEKGRVKVQFQWQKAKGKTTNWIRVQTPDAGKSDQVPKNRGFVFIPEEEDIVMIDFEYGDPNRPYVAGSIFSEKVSEGGKELNRHKTMTTRTGSQIHFDDERHDGSLTLYDNLNSRSMIDMDGNQNIMITAGSTLTINVGNEASVFKMNEEGEIFIYAKKKIELCVGGHTYQMKYEEDTHVVEVEEESQSRNAGKNLLEMTPPVTSLSTPKKIESYTKVQQHHATKLVEIIQHGETGKIRINGDWTDIN